MTFPHFKEDAQKMIPIALFGSIGGFALWLISAFGHSTEAVLRSGNGFSENVVGAIVHMLLGSIAAILGVFFLAKPDLSNHRHHAYGLAIACGLSWAIIFEGVTNVVKSTITGQDIARVEDKGNQLNKLVSQLETGESDQAEIGIAAKYLYLSASESGDAGAKALASEKAIEAITQIGELSNEQPEGSAAALLEIGRAAELSKDPFVLDSSIKVLERLEKSSVLNPDSIQKLDRLRFRSRDFTPGGEPPSS